MGLRDGRDARTARCRKGASALRRRLGGHCRAASGLRLDASVGAGVRGVGVAALAGRHTTSFVISA